MTAPAQSAQLRSSIMPKRTTRGGWSWSTSAPRISPRTATASAWWSSCTSCTPSTGTARCTEDRWPSGRSGRHSPPQPGMGCWGRSSPFPASVSSPGLGIGASPASGNISPNEMSTSARSERSADRKGSSMAAFHSSAIIAQWLFLKLLGGVYFLAFASLFVQVEGLYGARGILPIGNYVGAIREELGARVWRYFPSLFWLSSSDFFLHLTAGLGMVLSLLPVCGILTVPALVLLWLLYLSFVSLGQEFLSYQWDALLLEAGFMG